MFTDNVECPPRTSNTFNADMSVCLFPQGTILRGLYFGIHEIAKDSSWYLTSIHAYNQKKQAVAHIDAEWKICKSKPVALNPAERIVSARVDSNGSHPVQVTFVIVDMDLIQCDTGKVPVLPPISPSSSLSAPMTVKPSRIGTRKPSERSHTSHAK